MYKKIIKSQAEKIIKHIEIANEYADSRFGDSTKMFYNQLIDLCQSKTLLQGIIFSHEIANQYTDGSILGNQTLLTNLHQIIATLEIIDTKETTYAKPYFSEIKDIIIDQINSSKYLIWVAVAWFTDKSIYNALINAKNRGVNVQVLLLDHANNKNTSGQYILTFSKQIEAHYFKGYNPNQANLHHKFCVIDFETVITGSYNWTNSASQNSEDVVLIKDRDMTLEYAEKFIELKLK